MHTQDQPPARTGKPRFQYQDDGYYWCIDTSNETRVMHARIGPFHSLDAAWEAQSGGGYRYRVVVVT